MTISQAIKELKEQKLSLDRHVTRGATYCADYAEALGMAIAALKKQVPRAALGAKCPNCGELVDRELDYCDCGQAIAWTVTDCIQITCKYCCFPDDKNLVCHRYADKVDEIRRIHEEG